MSDDKRVIQLLLSSAFEDPAELKGLSPEVQRELLNAKAFEYRGAKYGLESLFTPKGFSVALAIVEVGDKVAVSYGFAKAEGNTPEMFMEADRRALREALREAESLIRGYEPERGTPPKSKQVVEEPLPKPAPQPERRKEMELRERKEELYEEKPKVNTYQRKFFSLVARLNWSLDKAKAFLRKHTGKDSTKDVEPEEWNKILSILEEQLKRSSHEEIEEDEWEELFS